MHLDLVLLFEGQRPSFLWHDIYRGNSWVVGEVVSFWHGLDFVRTNRGQALRLKVVIERVGDIDIEGRWGIGGRSAIKSRKHVGRIRSPGKTQAIRGPAYPHWFEMRKNDGNICTGSLSVALTIIVFDGAPPLFSKDIIHVHQSNVTGTNHPMIRDKNHVYDM